MATTCKHDFKDPEFMKLLAQEELILQVTEALCKIIRDEGVTRKQLADLLGKSKGAISQLLNGERNLTLRTVADILRVLGYKGLLTPHKEVQENNGCKDNIVIFPTSQTQSKTTVMKWEIGEIRLGEVLCSDTYPLYGNVAISMEAL